MSQPFLYSHYRQVPIGRTGPRHATIAPYGPFTVGDGVIFLAVQNEREWRRLCAEVLLRPDLTDDERFATNPARVAHEALLRAEIEKALAAETIEPLATRLDECQIANAVLRSVDELAEHPALVERGRWRSVSTPNGDVAALLPPAVIDGVEPVLGPVPAVGADTERLRAEFVPLP
jgi:formyl-CoA transferase